MQERNNQEIGHSTTKIVEARQRSPLRESRYSPYYADRSPMRTQVVTETVVREKYGAGETAKTYGASTAVSGGTRGSPLRSSYKPTYKQ